jgi:hypothetical protein
MIVYDDLQPRKKIRLYDVRLERPPHYDTFADFPYSYHYGDSYILHIKQRGPITFAWLHDQTSSSERVQVSKPCIRHRWRYE